MLSTFLGRVLGGLSLLNLIDDLSPINLNGKLLNLSKAYHEFIKAWISPLFGWIHFSWISISPTETHVIVVQCILITAILRGAVRNSDGNWSLKDVAYLPVVYFSFLRYSLFPALLLPIWIGTIGAIIGAVFVAALYAVNSDDIPRRYAWEEIKGIALAFFILIILNYTWFS